MVLAAGAVILASVHGLRLLPEEEAFFRDYQPAGVTLFSRNFSSSKAQVQDLIAEIQATRGPNAPPLIIAVDQEGGRVSRMRELKDIIDLGPPLHLAQGRYDEHSLKKISEYAFQLGQGLHELGINVNFAPVCDVLTEPNNHAIGDRALGTEPFAVAKRARAFLEGLHQAQVWGCLKHFPGQGAANVDTHKSTCVIEKSFSDLMACELVPFKELLSCAQLVMSSHCCYPKVDEQPASLSRVWAQDILRQQFGYQGLLLSDDMLMEAMPQASGAWEDAIVKSLSSGHELILVCQGLERAKRAVLALDQQVQHDAQFNIVVQQAAQKIRQFRHSLTSSV